MNYEAPQVYECHVSDWKEELDCMLCDLCMSYTIDEYEFMEALAMFILDIAEVSKISLEDMEILFNECLEKYRNRIRN